MNDRAWLAHLVAHARSRICDGVYLIVPGRPAWGDRVEVRPGLFGVSTTRALPPGARDWTDKTASVVMVARASLSRWLLGLA